MKEKLFYILPIVIILLCLENLFLQFTFQPPFDMVKSATMFERTDPSEKNPDEKKSSFYFGKGLILQAYYFSGLLNEIQDSDTPNDGKPEKTIAAIEKEIASIKISAAFKVFLIFLSLSTLVAIYHNVWFAIFMGRFLFLSSILLHLTKYERFYDSGNWVGSKIAKISNITNCISRRSRERK
ncbi:MAG: hypothetical protein K8R21_12550 [Leptospira sp.]|nr:hypothetical protein [Leptospira sp.]